jgi:hypothetical protein
MKTITSKVNSSNLNVYNSSLNDIRDFNLEKTFQFFDGLNQDKTHYSTNDDFCTPMDCVKKMVDYIPLEFWRKESLRILDPCAGNGNFGSYLRFLTREDNIWYNEINTIRYNNLIKLLNPKNIRLGDGLNLTDSFSGEWDLVVANPPYSGGANKNKSISNSFIVESINILKNKGFLCFITPNNWMTYNNNNKTLKKLLEEGSFLVIDNDAKKFFPKVGSSFTIFIWQKGVFNNKTKIYNNYLIKDTRSEILIPKELKFLPLYISEETISLSLKCIDNKRNSFKYRCDLHNFTQKTKLNDEKNDTFLYPTIHTKKKLRFSLIKQDIFDKFLIIVPLTTYFIPYKVQGFNVTQSVGYFEFNTNEEATQMLNLLSKKYIKVIVHLTRYGNFNNLKLLKHLVINEDLLLNEKELLTIETLHSLIKY